MTRWSLKVRVGVYSALLTMTALVAGVLIMMATLYLHQIDGLDRDLEGDARELVWDLKNSRDAPKDTSAPLSEKLIPLDMRDYYLVVENLEGQVVYQSPNLKGARLTGEMGGTRTIDLLGNACRVGAWEEKPYRVRVGAQLHLIERFQKDFGVGFAIAIPAVGLLVFFGGWWLGRRAVGPVSALSRAAERITTSNPQERLPAPGARDEIAKLTEVLNRSFDRLQTSYEVAARFSADASHQLKTPVTILRAGLDHLSQAGDLNDSQLAEVSLLRHQTRRLNSLIEDLLLLAQVDSGRMYLELEELDLKVLIQAAVDDLHALVEERGIRVEEDLSEPLALKVDRRLISMVLQNLVENAAKYSPDGGIIRVTARKETGWLIVKIANTGQEISEEDRDQIFERFGRGSGVGGNVRGHGLGLSIARGLLRAHGGDLQLNRPGSGWVEFELRLQVS